VTDVKGSDSVVEIRHRHDTNESCPMVSPTCQTSVTSLKQGAYLRRHRGCHQCRQSASKCN